MSEKIIYLGKKGGQAMPILDIIESIITITALVGLVIYISYKRKSQRV